MGRLLSKLQARDRTQLLVIVYETLLVTRADDRPRDKSHSRKTICELPELL